MLFVGWGRMSGKWWCAKTDARLRECKRLAADDGLAVDAGPHVQSQAGATSLVIELLGAS
jgi:hypothetical protein